MRKRGGHRPNAVPAKQSGSPTLGECVENNRALTRKNTRERRKMIRDNCDFCLEYAYLYRNQLSMRRQGRKFMCEQCRFENGRQEEAKENKYLPCWIKMGGWKPK